MKCIKTEDAIELLKAITSTDYDWQSTAYDSIFKIKNMEVDVPDITYCKNCKWAKEASYIFFSCLECTNPRGLDRIVTHDDFCSYGK